MDTKPTHKFELAGLGRAPFKCASVQYKTFQACPGAPIQPGSSCDYCGEAICYEFWIRSADDRTFKVGSTCITKVGDQGLIKAVKAYQSDKRREKRVAKIEAQRETRKIKAGLAAESFLQGRPDVKEALSFADRHPILQDLAISLQKYGKLTERQIELALKLAKKIQEPAEVKVPIVPGRRIIRATILSTRIDDGFYGRSQFKMLIKTDDGQKLWGTVPRALCWYEVNPGIVTPQKVEVGSTIKFTATVEVSPNDPCFGFFSKPTKAKYTSQELTAA